MKANLNYPIKIEKSLINGKLIEIEVDDEVLVSYTTPASGKLFITGEYIANINPDDLTKKDLVALLGNLNNVNTSKYADDAEEAKELLNPYAMDEDEAKTKIAAYSLTEAEAIKKLKAAGFAVEKL